MQDFEEQPTHGTHPFHIVPDSKSQDLVSFLGPFSICDLYFFYDCWTHLVILFCLFHLPFSFIVHTKGISFCVVFWSHMFSW
jgi:hypothetical protein